MIEYGDRTRYLPAPPRVVWDDLVERRSSGIRAWVHLRHDEVPPTVIESERPTRVVWSSLWPERADDRIVLELGTRGFETALRFRLLAAGEPPDEATTRRIRHRVNELLYGDLRQSYDQ